MRPRTLLALLLLTVPASAFGQEGDAKATSLAKELLDKGAALFDKRDAPAMAATYIETGQIILIKRPSAEDRPEIETRSGRAEIEKGYGDIFKDRLPEHKCRNTVESATFLRPDMLLIRGRFALNAEQGDSIQFVQIRTREGDDWKIATMQLMELAK